MVYCIPSFLPLLLLAFDSESITPVSHLHCSTRKSRVCVCVCLCDVVGWPMSNWCTSSYGCSICTLRTRRAFTRVSASATELTMRTHIAQLHFTSAHTDTHTRTHARSLTHSLTRHTSQPFLLGFFLFTLIVHKVSTHLFSSAHTHTILRLTCARLLCPATLWPCRLAQFVGMGALLALPVNTAPASPNGVDLIKTNPPSN